ncbi:MAG: hypothetical protein ACOYM7_06775 [Paludibacter sp.]
MKKILLAIIPLLMVAISFNSCTTEEATMIATKNTFSIPEATAPLNHAKIAPTTTTTLKWASKGGAAVKWDVYFGTSDSPDLLKADHTTQEISVTVAEGKTYYWYVENVDAEGIVTTSPLFTFDVAVTPIPKVVYNIDDFVGAYKVTEGTYVYNVNLTKVDAKTLRNDNFWDMGAVPLWVQDYVFDDYGHVTMTPSTYRATATATTMYSVTGAGTYNVATKTISVDYEVLKKVYTLKIDGTVSVVTTSADKGTGVMVKQ